MKWNGKLLFLLIGLSLTGCTDVIQKVRSTSNMDVDIMPKPNHEVFQKGSFILEDTYSIESPEIFNNEKEYLIQLLDENFGAKNTDSDSKIIFIQDSSIFNKEGYELIVDFKEITIKSNTPEGISRGIQTLRQMLIQSAAVNSMAGIAIPRVQIKDAPKFEHRGLLLDCSRHFFKKDVVKKYIDLLALYKMNTLHWHLTEDQGWRIVIDKYPNLTKVGAYRTELDGSKYGGFYSKEDIREIVAYAKERHINVIPEVELPGHSQAAISAYPNLSCTGEQYPVANDWGVFKEIYCAGNDSVFVFLEDVLDEVMELFPSKYIHIGGDEAPKFRWENCPKCQKRIKNEGLKDEHELQSYFINRIEKHLNKNGRQLIGWDEILEGDISKTATIQSWRGMEHGIHAAKNGSYAIMSPTSHCYLDYDLKSIDLEKVYSFKLYPDNLNEELKQFILGGEVNMWSEHVPNEEVLDSKVFPRLMAMSEVLWSYPEKRNYDHFYERIQKHYPYLRQMNVNVGLENHPFQVKSTIINGKTVIEIEPGNQDLDIKYSYGVDENKSYQGPINILKSDSITISAHKNGQSYGEPEKHNIVYHKALGESMIYGNMYSPYYESNKKLALVDGLTGSLDFRDGKWQGFYGKDFGNMIRFDSITNISEVSIQFYQYINSWIFIPESVSIEYSLDGENYIKSEPKTAQTPNNQRGKLIEQFVFDLDKVQAKYLKVKAKALPKVPEWHEAAGSPTWLFIDEIVVK